MRITNILGGFQLNAPAEQTNDLLEATEVRVERIVSQGHASPEDTWLDQDRHEWVLLVKGAARLRFEGDTHAISMAAGDSIDIPAHTRHRVEWTTPEEPTVWLALHYQNRR